MYSIQKRDRPLEIHPPRRMRATPEGDDSECTSDKYGYELEPEKAYHGKGHAKYDSESGDDGEYDNTDSEGDTEDDTEDDDSDSDGEDSEDSEYTTTDSERTTGPASVVSSESSPNLAETAQQPASATAPIMTASKANGIIQIPTVPTPPITPTKPTGPPSSLLASPTGKPTLSQSSPQRRQTPMVSPPLSSVKTRNSFNFNGVASKASASVFSKEM